MLFAASSLLFALFSCTEKKSLKHDSESRSESASADSASILELETSDTERLSSKESAELAELMIKLRSNSAQIDEIMDQVSGSFSLSAQAAFAREILRLGNPDLSLRAVELLSGQSSSLILPVLQDALHSSEESVRTAAAAAAGHITHPEVVDLFSQIFDDPSETVRLTGTLALDEQHPAQRLSILDRALQARHGDVQLSAVNDLQTSSSRTALEILFQALDSSVTEVRDEARFAIDFLVEKEFQSAAEARQWWKENRGRFDNDLAPQE